jgi:hypothetical protein
MKRTSITTKIRASIAACAVLGATGVAAEEGSYWGMIVGSAHGGGDLNNFNPGLTYGRKWGLTNPAYEGFIEGGVFYNSYEEISPIMTAGITRRLGEISSHEVRGGIAVGFARYAKLAPSLERDYGIPNIGGFVPIALGSVILRGDGRDYRVSVLPADRDIKYVINFSVTFDF